MCILLGVRPLRRSGELWLAANRDEKLDRPWEPPRLLLDEPRVFGGRDLIGGGSWLAVNLAAGFVVGVTNARLGGSPRERSRGTLVLDAASQPSLPDAVALVSQLDLARYREFNLLLADVNASWLATNEPEPMVTHAKNAAVAALGNGPLFSEPGDRVALAVLQALQAADLPEEDGVDALQAVLADHSGADPLCRHGERYGTVCSTVLTLRGNALVRYLFAPGPPCTTAFEGLAVPAVPRE